MGVFCWCDKCGQVLVNEAALARHGAAGSCHWFQVGEEVDCIIPNTGGEKTQRGQITRIDRSDRRRPPKAWVETGQGEVDYELSELRPRYRADILTKAVT